MAQGIQPASASQHLGLSASGARGPTPKVAVAYPLEWTSNSPESNLEGGLVGGRSRPIALWPLFESCNTSNTTRYTRPKNRVIAPKFLSHFLIPLAGPREVSLSTPRGASLPSPRFAHIAAQSHRIQVHQLGLEFGDVYSSVQESACPHFRWRLKSSSEYGQPGRPRKNLRPAGRSANHGGRSDARERDHLA